MRRDTSRPGLVRSARELFMRFAASGMVSPARFLPLAPTPELLRPTSGNLSLEIVSHCWRYPHLLAYQLSSLVRYPPTELSVTMTVFHSGEDLETLAMLDFFGATDIPGVTWNWQHLDRQHLFRRAIGRNLAALSSTADWVWFTDCDVIFHRGCLDGLAQQVQGRRDVLVFPRVEYCTPLLPVGHPLLTAAEDAPRVVDIDPSLFLARERSRATGPMQIVHGDAARTVGYCACLSTYQLPAERWQKCHEDRAFRWLLRTQGEALEVPGVYRIRHASKGRYSSWMLSRGLRGGIRRVRSWWQERSMGTDAGKS